MKKLVKSGLSLTLSVLSVGVAAQASQQPKVVYGEDDRMEIFEAPEAMQLVAKSTAAMIAPRDLTLNEDGTYLADQSELHSNGICKDDPYANQPTTANCSGFLIGPDLIVTAGHCIRNQFACNNQRWVFDYAVDAVTKEAGKAIPAENIYSCKLLVNQALSSFVGTDHALIQLDRVVKDRSPLKYRSEGKIEDATSIVVMGHPMGLPTKIADGANVRTNTHPHYFIANLDTFGGNSGSAVFDTETLTVEGILVRGETDYAYNREKMCAEIFKCDDDKCRGEDVSRITSILELALRDQVLQAAAIGDLAQVESYLAMKGWVNMYDNARESILIKAVKGEQPAVINTLLDVRADVNHADLKGQTALHFLASNKEVSEKAELVIESLKKAQLNFDAKDELGETPLMKAAQSRNVRMVEILIEAGADLKAVNNEGKDALKLTRLIGVKASKIRRMIKKALKQKA